MAPASSPPQSHGARRAAALSFYVACLAPDQAMRCLSGDLRERAFEIDAERARPWGLLVDRHDFMGARAAETTLSPCRQGSRVVVAQLYRRAQALNTDVIRASTAAWPTPFSSCRCRWHGPASGSRFQARPLMRLRACA